MSNLLILPFILPALCAFILVFIRERSLLSRIFAIGTMAVSTIISLILLIYVLNHKPITLDFGIEANSSFFCTSKTVRND